MEILDRRTQRARSSLLRGLSDLLFKSAWIFLKEDVRNMEAEI
jgi:hypothetical protein